MLVRSFILLVFLLFQQTFLICVRSEIIQTDTIDTILNYVESPTDLIIFDLDETLITLDHGEHWISEICKQYTVTDFEKTKYLYLWYVLREEHRLLEEHAAQLIVELQQRRGCKVIALTARHTAPLIAHTVEQLAQLGIDFSRSGISNENFMIEGLFPLARYYKGIIFAGSHNKGTVLMRVLDRLGITPTKIIFVDDKLHHLQSVQMKAGERGIPFIGLRYSRSDDKCVSLSSEDQASYLAWFEDIIL